jgi:hypothetical protein
MFNRSASSFSIGRSSDGDTDSDASSEDSQRWQDIDSDDLDPRYSSDDEDSDAEFDSPETLQGQFSQLSCSLFWNIYTLASFLPFCNVDLLYNFETVPTEPEIKSSPSFPVRSIPYSSYLKRYSVSASHSSHHRNPYMPPPRVLFSQSKVMYILFVFGLLVKRVLST